MDTKKYFKLREELSARWYSEQPAAIWVNPVTGKVEAVWSDEKEYIDYHMERIYKC